jgi:hypothetical protein
MAGRQRFLCTSLFSKIIGVWLRAGRNVIYGWREHALGRENALAATRADQVGSHPHEGDLDDAVSFLWEAGDCVAKAQRPRP